ncbi:hypothetical protein EYB25_003752 [Talaromyces marneffei]|uniref:Zn(2)-C6 fungal-type domain-containing protein n=1 Tax=Talaromyces marneffei (strain ATCC 18224 / CBS 334.59 / QM 7333) TaxID=441960 RepID=B6QBZ2_TALMQ|nr:conserved hypothetical protein [Talaromyces marneffei ATCC 18224]KAE8555204.1 hypothetical protein EYB25_003752 [Talaromyces marneffei]
MPSVPCDACALRRVKCDGNNPCWICIKNGQQCTFLKVRRRRGPKGPRKSTKIKLEQLQAQLSLPRANTLDQKPISLGIYFTYLDIYKDSLYTTWPIVSIDSLKARLNDRQTIDYESYALAAALSAATIVQLKLTRSEAMTKKALIMEGEDFVKECLRHRNQCNYQNSININLLLTSLFLHMYYANTGQMNAATFALRETITYSDLLRLGDPFTLQFVYRDERELRLRVFWVLFVTERTFCIQHRIPMTMQKINEFPTFLDAHDINPHSVGGFCELIRLFTYVETGLVQSMPIEQAPSSSSYSKKELQSISTDLDSRTHHLNSLGDLQITDIETTRAWLRSLLWQHAASRFMLESDAKNVQFTPEYPFHLARDLLSFLSKVQSSSIRAHAYSMEVKLSQVAHSLLDTIAVVPSIGQMRGQQYGPEHVVIALEQLLGLTASGKSEHLSLLRSRMVELEVWGPSRLCLTLPTHPQIESEVDDEHESGSVLGAGLEEEINAWVLNAPCGVEK